MGTSDDDNSPDFSVLVPAHNEERVIGRTLASMLAGGPSRGSLDIIVICNGCTDHTAEVARSMGPRVRVIELAVGCKTLAINAGLQQVRAKPVIIVDGDVDIGGADLMALADVLRRPGVMAASPVAKMDCTDSDSWTRSYYRVWEQHGYLSSGIGGSGVYGLSEAALNHIGSFPEFIADDTYVRWEFPLWQQARLGADNQGRPVFSTVRAPKRVQDLIRCEARWYSGTKELLKAGKRPNGGKWKSVRAEGGRCLPYSFRDRAVFYSIKLVGRAVYLWNVAQGRARQWHRDSSHRQ